MEVLKINLSNLHNEEWFGFHSAYKKLVARFGEDKLHIADLYILFLSLLYKADNLLLVLRKSVYTANMKAADKERTTFFNNLYAVTKRMRDLPDPAKKEAAGRLFNLLHQYKQYAVKGGYAEESPGVYNLLQDLDGAYKADVTLLVLGEWVSALREAEKKFSDLHEQRIQETVDKPKESLAETRMQLDKLYNGMVNILEAKLLADGLAGDVVVDPNSLDNGAWADDDPTPPELRGNITYNFVIAWNVIVKEYHSLLAARSTRLSKKKQPETPDPSLPEEDIPAMPPEPDPDTDEID
jgi:hypothetical protein